MKKKRRELNEIISLIKPKSPATESYRTLYTNIQFSALDHSIRTITITSPGASEGKSTTAINLAVTYAQTGKQVLLVDMDLRKPRIHKYLNLPNNCGLTNVLVSRMELDEAVHAVKENFSVLTTGPLPPNSVELLSSKAMTTFYDNMLERYDVIIYDTPPIGIVTDAALLAAKTDATLLVVASGRTNIELSKQAKINLENVNANLLGTVITMVPTNVSKYSGYQYYSYAEEEKKKRWGRK